MKNYISLYFILNFTALSQASFEEYTLSVIGVGSLCCTIGCTLFNSIFFIVSESSTGGAISELVTTSEVSELSDVFGDVHGVVGSSLTHINRPFIWCKINPLHLKFFCCVCVWAIYGVLNFVVSNITDIYKTFAGRPGEGSNDESKKDNNASSSVKRQKVNTWNSARRLKANAKDRVRYHKNTAGGSGNGGGDDGDGKKRYDIKGQSD